MSGSLAAALEPETLAPATKQLRAVLSRTLRRRRPGTRIAHIERAPCPYGSSWWLEDVTLHLDDGARIALVFKDLGRETNGSGASRVKPAFVTDPTREPWVYRTLLPQAPPGPPALWASVSNPAAARHWLFLERIDGAPLAEHGHRAAWGAAARWLGHFHAKAPVARGPLLHHDRAFHRGWAARALSAAQAEAERPGVARAEGRERLARLRALLPMHERATDVALAMRPSLIHGEFYPSNVLVEASGGSHSVHPVDWEMAALGPPLLDLAALLSGRWGPDDRNAMMNAYRDGARAAGARGSGLDEFLRSLAACRLLLAMQWLGWAAAWTAPPGHRNDWLEEAERCAGELRG